MAKDTIFVDTREIDRLIVELKGFDEQVAEATYQAIKRTIEHVKTQTAKIISKEYSVKTGFVKGFFKGGIKTRSGAKGNCHEHLVIGRTLTLGEISPLSYRPPPKRRKYKVKVTIKEEQGKKLKPLRSLLLPRRRTSV